MGALVRPVSSMAWELRAAWASGRRVSLSLDLADLARVEGIVSRVSPSGAFVLVGGLHVPFERVLAVHWPSRLGDSTHKGATGWRGPGHRWEPQDTALWYGDVPV